MASLGFRSRPATECVSWPLLPDDVSSLSGIFRKNGPRHTVHTARELRYGCVCELHGPRRRTDTGMSCSLRWDYGKGNMPKSGWRMQRKGPPLPLVAFKEPTHSFSLQKNDVWYVRFFEAGGRLVNRGRQLRSKKLPSKSLPGLEVETGIWRKLNLDMRGHNWHIE